MKVGAKVDDRPSRALAVPQSGGGIVVPPCPPTLPEGATEAWAVVCGGLPGLTAADLGDVEIAVRSLHEFRAISKLLDDNGYTRVVTDPETGATAVIVPEAVRILHRMRKDAANTYRYHADQLGLSRMSRARLNLLDLASQNELASLADRVAAMRA